MDAFTPQQTTELCARIGTKKATTRLDKLFVNSFLTGPLLGFGCAVVLSTEASPWFQTNAPGLLRTLSATYFPIGLVMIVLSGSDLFTSNVMFMILALLERRITILDLGKVWVVSFFGNLAGCLFFVAFVLCYSGVYQMEVYSQAVINFATMKVVDPQWHQIMLRAIGANWLVCFAVFISISSREIVSKIAAIWFPTATFVAIGLDHVIANMIWVPTAIWYGHPVISVSFYIWKSMIPTLIGNLIGGGIFVGSAYWYLYLTGEGSVEIEFNTGGINSAMVVGGPLGPSRDIGGLPQTTIINGQVPREKYADMHLPDSRGLMTGGISKELSGESYGKRLVEEPNHVSEPNV